MYILNIVETKGWTHAYKYIGKNKFYYILIKEQQVDWLKTPLIQCVLCGAKFNWERAEFGKNFN
jgi:hypothetical protein